MSEKQYVYAKGANGMTARVPKDKLAQWQQAQEKQAQALSSGQTPELSSEEQQIAKQLTSLLLGK